MLYTDNSATGWMHLEKKAAFLLVPITLVSTTLVSRATAVLLMRIFMAACIAATLVCLGHATWQILTGSPQLNFGPVTMNEYERLNPGASIAWLQYSYVSLASGVGMHPTYFGFYLCVCLLFILHFLDGDLFSKPERRVAPFVFVYIVLFIFFLSSRIGIITAAAITLMALFQIARKHSFKHLWLQQIVAVSLFLICMYANPVSRFRGLQEPSSASIETLPTYATTSVEIRLSLLQLSQIASSSVNMWVGAGTGSGVDHLRTVGVERGISNLMGSYDPHNQFIYTFFELGCLGLASLLAALFVPLHHALKKRAHLFAVFSLAFIAVCLTESALELQKGIIIFSFFGSLLMFHYHNPARETK